MTTTDKLTDELLEAYASGKWKSYERDNIAMARELLALRASQAAPAPSDGLREALTECIEAVEAWEKGEQPKADFHVWLAKARAALSTPTEERQ